MTTNTAKEFRGRGELSSWSKAIRLQIQRRKKRLICGHVQFFAFHLVPADFARDGGGLETPARAIRKDAMSIRATTPKRSKRRRRSTAVPLSIVPMLAAAVTMSACDTRPSMDPCEPVSYMQAACDSAVTHRGYWYGGTWYPHVYSYLPLYYYNGYRSYLGGGRGFGSIGEGHGASGS
jgi:hypothetical protein